MASVQDSVREEVQKLTGGHVTLEIAQTLREHVLDACRSGGAGDPLNTDPQVRETGKAWCIAVTSFLSGKKWFLPAQNLLRKLWESYAERQRSSKQRVYRALLSQLLTEVAYEVGNDAEAFRWSLLTQADDILGEYSQEGGHSKHWLYAKFGLSDVEKKALDAMAKKCRREAKAKGWHSPSGFAEEVLRRFAQSRRNGRDVFQRLSGTEEFHLTRPYLRVLLDHMKHMRGSQPKGKCLEDIAFYLFSLLPGCVPRRNLRDRAGASEYDLVVSNMSPTSSLIGDVFGRDFLIECKNWNKAVGARDVGYFLFRMGLTHCHFGVIIAAQNVTGKLTGDTHARAIVRRAFHEHGSACVVVSMSDLENLACGQISGITSLLIERLSDFRFGKQGRPVL
jgi:hypothetical protein